MGHIRRSIVLAVVPTSVAGACGSGGDAAGPGNGATGVTGDPTGTSGATSPTGPTGPPAAIDACGLVDESDAVATLEGSPT